MKWLFPILLLAGIATAGIIPVQRDRAVAVARVVATTCRADAGEDANGSSLLMWTLRVADDRDRMTVELSNDQLIALGFDRHAVGLVGQLSPDNWEAPRPLPVWLRLAPDSAHGGRLTVQQVARNREGLGHDPAALVVQARLGFAAAPRPMAENPADTAPRARRPVARVIVIQLYELIPNRLHLSAAQDAILQKSGGDSQCLGSHARIVVAMGAKGALWVEKLSF